MCGGSRALEKLATETRHVAVGNKLEQRLLRLELLEPRRRSNTEDKDLTERHGTRSKLLVSVARTFRKTSREGWEQRWIVAERRGRVGP